MINNKKVAIYGLGYLGYTTLSNLVDNYIECYVYDYKAGRRNSNESIELFNNYFDSLFLTENNYIQKKSLINFTNEVELFESEEIYTHIICIATELSGVPNVLLLENIISNFKKVENKIIHIIIESTLYPNNIDNTIIPIFNNNNMKIDEDYLLSFVVRQDVNKNIKDLKKDNTYILSSFSDMSLKIVKEFYSYIGQDYIVTKDYKALEMTKHIENSLLHLHESFANQILLSFPNINANEVFNIVKKHVGVELQASIGSNGFAMPVSSRVLLDCAEYSDNLSLLKESIMVDMSMITVVEEDLINNNIKIVLILGVSSDDEIKQDIFSAYFRLVEYLRNNNFTVYIYDPYFSSEEINSKTHAYAVSNIDYLSNDIEGIVVGAKHSWTKFLDMKVFINNISNVNYFLDNGSFTAYKEKINNYKSIGDTNCFERL
jgi:nucleotide sugar dehydrogenase